MSKYRTLEAADGGPLVNNFRPDQPLNSRVVTYKSFNECDEIYGTAAVLYPSMWNSFWWNQCLAHYNVNSFFSYLNTFEFSYLFSNEIKRLILAMTKEN